MRRLFVIATLALALPLFVSAQTPQGPLAPIGGPGTSVGGGSVPPPVTPPTKPPTVPPVNTGAGTQQTPATAAQTATTQTQTTVRVRTLSRGMRGADVLEMQQALVVLGFLQADGATGYFGALTEAAVKSFQRKNGIVSSGSPTTTGYGAIGPRTRAKILAGLQSSGGSGSPMTVSNSSTNLNNSATPGNNPTGTSASTGGTSGTQSDTSPTYDWLSWTYNSGGTNSGTGGTNVGIATNASCSFNGQSIAHGGSIMAYLTSSVGSGSQCSGQLRSCANGVLSGSYTYAQCSISTTSNTPASCAFNTQTIPHGASVTAYQSATVSAGSQCLSQTRACTNGTLSGTYSFPTCSVSSTTNAPCTFNGQSVSHGASVTAYQTSSVAYGSQCVTQSRTCNNGILSGSYTNGTCSVGTQSTRVWKSPLTMAQVEQKRIQDWSPKNLYWESYWDGTDTPADNVPGPFMWDNPVDDDWFDPYTLGYSAYLDQDRLNTPSRGFMTVDRTYGNLNKNGHFFTRDNWLDSNFTHSLIGLTLEVRVKLLPQSQKDSFFINYIGGDCSISVALSGADPLSSVGLISPVTIRGTVNGTPTEHIAMDTTSDFVTYRVVHAPGASTYSVYAVAYANENDPKPAQSAKLIEGPCDSSFTVANTRYIYPYIQVGDNLSASDRNAAYILDYIRYRRDAYTPSENLSTRQQRFPMSLPSQQPSEEEHLFAPGYLGSVSGGYFGDVPINASDVKDKMGERVTFPEYYPSHKDSGMPGVAQLTTSGIYSYAEVIHPRGLVDKGDFTIEARLKFLPGTGERGFRIMDLDGMGAISLFFSKDKVETGMGLKPTGFQKVSMDTTDGFHTYRLVRKAGEMYAHLYIDNDPVPAITDARLSAEIETYGFEANPILYFGGQFFKGVPFVWPVPTTNVDVLIDYVRWYGYAFAP